MPQQKLQGNNTKALFGVTLISLLAIPVCYLLSFTTQMDEPFWVFVAGVVICFTGIPIIVWLFLVGNLPKSAKQNIYFYVFCVFSFTAIVDLLIGLTLDGYIDTLLFYLNNGEPYLKSPHGCMINYWDGTIHFALYIAMTFRIASSKSFRSLGFFWFGSIMNSMIVFLPGNVLGPWGHEVQLSYLLNIPYTFFPISFFILLLSQTKFNNNNRNNNSSYNFKVLLSCYFVFAIILIFAISFFILLLSQTKFNNNNRNNNSSYNFKVLLSCYFVFAIIFCLFEERKR